MAVKSIIDIDVDDAKFQAFTKKFNAYRDAVKKLPGAWKESEKASESMADHFATMTAAMMAQNDLQKQSLVHQRAAGSHMRGMVRDSAAIARNIGGVTLNLLKWVGIGGLLGGAGLFGIGSLAGTVGGQRRSALGLGISTGQQAAFGVSYNRFVDTNATLGNIADAKSDYSKRWAFSAMGVNPEGKNPAALGVEMMVKAKEIFDKSGGSAQEAKAHGLLEIFSMEDLRRLHKTSMKELREREGNYRGTVDALSRRDDVNKRWVDFSDQLKDAGFRVQSLFVNTLGKNVVPALERLSKSAVTTLSNLVNNGDFEKGVTKFAHGISALANEIGRPEFQTKVKQFAGDVVSIATAIRAGLVKLGVIDDSESLTNQQLTGGIGAGAFTVTTPRQEAEIRRRGKPMWDLLRAGGLTAPGAAAAFSNLFQESGGDPYIIGDHGTAKGIGQWHADRQANFKKRYGYNLADPGKSREQSLKDQIDFFFWEGRNTESAAWSKFKNIHGSALDVAREGGAALSSGFFRPADKEGEMRERGKSAQVYLNIFNSTGSQVAVQGAQVAQ